MARTWRLLLAVAWFAAAQQAQAQTKGDDFSLDEPGASQEPAPPPPAEGEPTLLSDEQVLQEEAAPKEQFRQSSDPHEDPDKAYYFAGAGWRYLFIPQGVMNWFLESGPSV
jgi:hypothetical protein